MRTSAIGVNLFIFLHSLTHTYVHSWRAVFAPSDGSRDRRAVCTVHTIRSFFHNLTATVATLTHGNSHTHARTHEHAELVLRFVSIFAVYCCQVRATVNGFLFCTSFYLSLAKASAKNQLFFFVCVRQLTVALIREGSQKQKRKY